MNPRALHQEAMNFSFQAKEALTRGDDAEAFELYAKAAEKESEVAHFYYDKPELEPTRSIIVRSAAFLNLKAGKVDEAQQFIFWGLLHLTDEAIKDQLNDALSIAVMLKNVPASDVRFFSEYFNRLRQRSIYYSLESKTNTFSTAVTLDMVREFLDELTKSVRAYAGIQFKKLAVTLKKVPTDIETSRREFEEWALPLFTGASPGSLRFSLANDFIAREGEEPDVTRLKATTLIQYHNRIFTRTLDDEQIAALKLEYQPDELEQIFKPIAKIQSTKASYKVGYFDQESFAKRYLPRITVVQQKKLLLRDELQIENIGVIETSITHTRQVRQGKTARKVIQREKLSSASFPVRLNQLEPKDKRPIILEQELQLKVDFGAESGFRFTFSELGVEHSDIDFDRGLQTIQTLLYERIIAVVNRQLDPTLLSQWQPLIQRLITNVESLRRP